MSGLQDSRTPGLQGPGLPLQTVLISRLEQASRIVISLRDKDEEGKEEDKDEEEDKEEDERIRQAQKAALALV